MTMRRAALPFVIFLRVPPRALNGYRDFARLHAWA